MRILIVALAIVLLAFGSPDDGRGKDGHFHNPDTGEVQPDVCDNLEGNPHPCECAHAKPKCDGTDTKEYVGKKCQTWCRPKACMCDACCEEKKK